MTEHEFMARANPGMAQIAHTLQLSPHRLARMRAFHQQRRLDALRDHFLEIGWKEAARWVGGMVLEKRPLPEPQDNVPVALRYAAE